jgi:hypothetical protein
MKTLINALVIGMVFYAGNIYAKDVGILGITLGKSLPRCNSGEEKEVCYYSKEDQSWQADQVTRKNQHECWSAVTYGDLYVEFDSEKKRVIAITLMFSSEDKGELILKLLVNKFGKPTEHKQFPVQNRMGAVFDNVKCSWVIDGNTIHFRKRTNQLDRGFLILYNKEFDFVFEKEQKEKEDKLKKTF